MSTLLSKVVVRIAILRCNRLTTFALPDPSRLHFRMRIPDTFVLGHLSCTCHPPVTLLLSTPREILLSSQ